MIDTSSKPSITIGIMTRNYAQFIGQAIDSVVHQSRSDWELIIADDESTDNTAAIVATYLHDPRIRYVRHSEKLGQADNWNFLLNQGTAPCVTVLHADDYWLPGMLEQMLSAFDSDPEIDIVYTNWWRDWERKSERIVAVDLEPRLVTGIDEYRQQAERFQCHVSATALTRRAIEAAGPPDIRLSMVVDYEYLLRAFLSARKVRAVPEPLAIYRAHGSNATAEGTASGRLASEKENLVELCAGHIRIDLRSRYCLPIIRRHMAESIFSMGVTAGANGDLVLGQQLMARATRLDPSLLYNVKYLCDYLLGRCGNSALPVLQRLHNRRVYD